MTNDGAAGRPITGSGHVPTPLSTRRLGRDQILREAVRFIDANGREQLTMLRLGAELGV